MIKKNTSKSLEKIIGEKSLVTLGDNSYAYNGLKTEVITPRPLILYQLAYTDKYMYTSKSNSQIIICMQPIKKMIITNVYAAAVVCMKCILDN